MSDDRLRSAARAGARGLVASMAMSGMRQVTVGMGWLEKTPPDEILHEEARLLLVPLAEGHEQAVVELAHWAYGTAFGSLYGLLPERVRRSRWSGPGLGLGTWLVYELAIASALGVQVAKRRTVLTRAMFVADHLLYGLVVADQAAPEPAR